MMLIGGPGTASARSGGRIRGGSFHPPSARSSAPSARSSAPRSSSSSSSGRRSSASSSSSAWGSARPGPSVIIERPPRTYYQPSPWLAPSPFSAPSQPVIVASGQSVSDDLIVAGGLALGALSVFRNNRDGSGSSSWTDSKFTVVKLSVGVRCKDRGPRSLLGQLSTLAAEGDAASEAGRRALATDVCLALLRQQSQWHAAGLEAAAFSSPANAEAALSRLSLQERAKIDRETVNKINGKDRSEARQLELEQRALARGAGAGASGSATEAVVTLVLGFAGDISAELLQMKPTDPQSLKTLLQTIASTSAQPDSLQVAEVVWSPEEPWETLVPEDIVESHPELIIL